MEFTDRLKEIIKISGLKRDGFAKNGGISRTQLFRYLNGEQEPSTAFYRNIKSHHSWININWLISGEGKPDISFNRGMNYDLLKEIIEGVEQSLNEEELDLLPDRKAKLITLLHEHFIEEKQKINRTTIKRFLRLVA